MEDHSTPQSDNPAREEGIFSIKNTLLTFYIGPSATYRETLRTYHLLQDEIRKIIMGFQITIAGQSGALLKFNMKN